LKRISILLIALLSLAVAACSSNQASSTASPSATPEPTAEATESATPSQDDEPVASGSAVAIPSFDLNGDPELASRFPDTVGGQPLQMQSFRGDAFMAGTTDPSFEQFLESVSADPQDVSVAFGGSVTGETVLSVGAFRVSGVPEDRLEEEFLASSEEAGDVSDLEQASISGKDVYTATTPDTSGSDMSVIIYTKDDTVYFLTGTEEQVAEILAALP